MAENRVAGGLGVLATVASLTVASVNPAGAAFPGRNGVIAWRQRPHR